MSKTVACKTRVSWATRLTGSLLPTDCTAVIRLEPQLHTQDPKCNPEKGNRSVGPFRHGVLVHKGWKDADLSTDCECDVTGQRHRWETQSPKVGRGRKGFTGPVTPLVTFGSSQQDRMPNFDKPGDTDVCYIILCAFLSLCWKYFTAEGGDGGGRKEGDKQEGGGREGGRNKVTCPSASGAGVHGPCTVSFCGEPQKSPR